MPKRESGEAQPVPRAKLTTRSVSPQEAALGPVKGEPNDVSTLLT